MAKTNNIKSVRKRENVKGKSRKAIMKKRTTKKKKEEGKVIVGYRKKAIARGYVKDGKGEIKINGKPLHIYFPPLMIHRIIEPIYLVGEDKIKNIDIDINVKGGGLTGQCDAVRQIIAKAIVEYYGDDALKEKFIEYDRSLLVPDVRQTEPHKPSRSKQGPRRKKQLSKR